MTRPKLAVIGTGGLARSIVPLLVHAGYPVVAIAARSSASARRLVRKTPGSRAATLPEDAARDAQIVLLAVPDRAIAPVATRLALALRVEASDKVFLHHAGALGVAPLAGHAVRTELAEHQPFLGAWLAIP